MRRWWVLVVVGMGLALPGVAEELSLAVQPAELDAPQCVAYDGGRALGTAPMGALLWKLALAPKPTTGPEQWTTGRLDGAVRHFRVAFTRSIALGTIVSTYTDGVSTETLFQRPIGLRVSLLKTDAPYPGDVTREDQWIVLPPGGVKTLPAGASTRAVRVTEYRPLGRIEPSESLFGSVVLLKERYFSPLLQGGEKEIENKGGSNAWIAYWTFTPPPALAGVVITRSRASGAAMAVIKAGVTTHPLHAKAADWRTLPAYTGDGGPKIYRLDAPLPTVGLRVSPRDGGIDFSYTMGQVVPLVNLGTAAEPPIVRLPPAPTQLGYTMPMDGFVAINILRKDTGKAVRRLLAEVPHLAGKVSEAWDLKDDQGQYVTPGDYEWRAITRPPLKLTYEITVNNAGQPAWWAPAPGKGGGGWLADHSAPNAVCAVGDVIFMGAPCAESGHAMIATDLEGNKLWGEGSMFGGFLGTRHFVGDDRYGYMINGAGILRLDTKDGLKRQPVALDITYTREVPGPGSGWGEYLTGAAARDGKLYLAYRAPAISWIQSTVAPADIDFKACQPPVLRVRAEKSYREGEYDEVQQLHSVFLDGAAASCVRNVWGEAPTSGAQAGTMTLALNKPVPVGSVLVPNSGVKVYALKAGKTLKDIGGQTEPGEDDDGGFDEDPLDPELWLPLTTAPTGQQPAVALTKDGGVTTMALRFKAPRIAYALLMSHRFADLAPAATRSCTDGKLTATGGWLVARDSKTRPMNAVDPAACVLVWKTPVSLRGVTLTGMVEAKTAVDYWIGPADGDPAAALTDDRQWRQAAVIEAEMNGPYPQTPSARSADFGANVTTRAVRIRAIAPKGDTSYMGRRGVPVSGPHEAGFASIVAYSHLGQDPELPVELAQRLSIFQLPANPAKAPAKLEKHLPLAEPGALAFGSDGTLYAQSDGRIVTVPLDGGAMREVIPRTALARPAGMAFDAAGKLYVADDGPKVITVFDLATGKSVRTIGTPGGPKLGAWDSTRLSAPASVTVDKLGRVWLAESDYQPKRISRWTTDGKLDASFLGPTEYGGGGFLDPRNRSVLNYHGMKFVIDWAKRSWKLDSLLYRPGLSIHSGYPDRPLYVNDRRYLVVDPSGENLATIAVERNGVAVPLVIAGNLARWRQVDQQPELRKAFGALNRGDFGFLWQDLNGDGAVQPVEVQLSETVKLLPTYWPARIGDNLALHFDGVRLRPTTIQPDGAPRYELKNAEVLPGMGISWETADGRTFVIGNKMLAPDGKSVLWEYPDDYLSVHGSHRIGYDRPPGVLVGEHHVNGHFTVKGEELFVTNGNHGDWFVFTRDGLLAGCIFGGPLQYGKRAWTMPEWIPGITDLSDINGGEEHFGGSVCMAEDGNVYAVAGHNHNSVVRVDGLERMQRLNGALTVTKADLEKTVLWEQQRALLARLQDAPKIAKVPSLDNPMTINGTLDDWPESLFMTIHERFDVEKKRNVPDMQVALAYDDEHLYLAGRVTSTNGPMRNNAEKLEYLYKFGDALDIQLGLDPAANPARQGPVAGDCRLLITRVKGKPVIMLYRHQVPEVAPEKRVHIASPVTETIVDLITEIKDATVVLSPEPTADPLGGPRGWSIEAAIPWREIGLPAPTVGARLRGDVGMLLGDEHGLRTIARYYWSGKNQTVVSDLAFEARIAPAVWGELLYDLPDKDMRFGPDAD
jgi:hypothetical protein